MRSLENVGTMTSTRTAPPETRPTPPPGVQSPDRLIQGRLKQASREVKRVDLFSSLMMLAAGLLAFFWAAALIDHWLLPLTVGGRWVFLAALVAGSLAYFAVAVLPLLLGRVNPLYAAHSIEQSAPTLKNSVVNFLLFRGDRAGLRTGVFEALKLRAAHDLSHVSPESAVDRTRLIRIGYGLIAILVLFAAYTILSPKDPLQTVRRIATPWADIPRPARVRIEHVLPGNEQVVQGQAVSVVARCYNLRPEEPVSLVWSSADERIQRQRISMRGGPGGLDYQAELPPDPEGLQQDLSYWIEAGDARSDTYRLQVLPAPTMLVEEVQYEYPAYTRRPPRVVSRQADVQAVEGTRVTVRARANQPIRWARLVFEPDPAADSPATLPPSVPLEVDQQQARGSFILSLDSQNRAPYAGYRLRFETPDGHTNSRAPLHRIAVTRDLSPEVEILTPEQPRIELPVDRAQQIEVRALDPDYGLRSLVLQAARDGADLFSETLFEHAEGHTGQVIRRFELRPWELELVAGDELVFWAVGRDNRRCWESDEYEPNWVRSSRYQVILLPPERDPVSAPDALEEDAVPPDDAEDAGGLEDDAGGDPEAGDPEAGEEEAGEEEAGEGSEAAAGADEDPTQPASADSPATDESEEQPGPGAVADEPAAPGQGAESGETGDTEDAAGDSPAGAGQQPEGASPGDGVADGDSTLGESADGRGDGAAGLAGESDAAEAADPAGGPRDAAATRESGAAEREEPLHDGEVFERALEYLRSQDSTDSEASAARRDALPEPGEPSTGDEELLADQEGLSPEPGEPEWDAAGQPQPPTEGSAAGDLEISESEDADPSADPSAAGGSDAPDAAVRGPGHESPSTATEPDESSGELPPEVEGHEGSGQTEQESADPPPAARGIDAPIQPDEADREADDGQGSNQPGSDRAGSRGAADEGSHVSPESGEGAATDQPGDRLFGQDHEGAPGTEAGDGQTSRPATPDAPLEAEGVDSQDAGDDPAGTADPHAAGTPAQDAADPQPADPETPGATPGSAAPGGWDGLGAVPEADEPHLEFARQATDLVLEHLRDQQQNPDPELLEQLDWTAEDLQAFLQRWQALYEQADQSEPDQRALEAALRSLGLRAEAAEVRRATGRTDGVGGLQETGVRGTPPARYREQFNAYRKGTARTDD